MKKIILVRHGKSAWDRPFLADHDRPLAERGLRDLPLMADRLVARMVKPSLFLSSSATRAVQTAEILANHFQYPLEEIQIEKNLYHSHPEIILKYLRMQKDKYDTILVFGHNPGFNDLIEYLGKPIDNLPTSGQCGFKFDTDHWSEISPNNASFWFIDYPKKKTR
ncbi:phosphohistidine phosphatase [Algoriphagus iocasae]|uniref:Phosphohistidine phosphatase n=1 Tax=Algoriphagus iocasae TaxID=1836499 RepID=A0A841MRJ5_9BACT|nr:histidine phosphatase family protein [Algoriphagus iocasae]MBB6324661.1 phosphohistidine phosphatase [Algoriphagus iocasae]